MGADDLERYGEAAWWSGKLREAIRLREESYAAYAREGSNVAAARVALTLSWDESRTSREALLEAMAKGGFHPLQAAAPE